MNGKKAAIVATTLLTAFFFSAGIASAQYAILITGQSGDETYSTDNFSSVVLEQGIGTDLRLTATALSWKMRGVVSSGGILEMKMSLNECSDATYTSCSSVALTEYTSPVWPTGTTVQTYTGQFLTAYTVNKDLWYTITLNAVGSATLSASSMRFVGTDYPDYFRGVDQEIVSNPGGMEAMYYDLLGEYTADGISIGAATSSSMFSNQNATSTLNDLADQCSQSGNFFAEAICISFSFLFMPGDVTIARWAALSDTFQAKFPFSWVFEAADLFDSLSETPTSAPVYSFNLANLGIGATTSMGNILPNFTAFSSSTVMQYIPSDVWNAFQALIAAGLWLLVGFDIYHTMRRRHAHV